MDGQIHTHTHTHTHNITYLINQNPLEFISTGMPVQILHYHKPLGLTLEKTLTIFQSEKWISC